MSSDGQEQHNNSNQTSKITLKIKYENRHDIYYYVRPIVKFKNIMNHYCNRQSLEINNVVFLFDGRQLRDEQTPEDLGMEDGDEIDAMLHQIGGSMINYT
ncbi:Small ubiquitin-related modifier 2 [Dendrobium catenatum]|uniref:Small ubiquitin-related modifier n=1 Tax=Dendrobium catenatum TaxID=906689 RepID=A0A2I0W7E5_9ASPA|nr:Small ubiquitin-related modifier 2 [Dendrobium catenatum]